MPETKLFEDKYFGVKRFDREDGEKFHVISAAGLGMPITDYQALIMRGYSLSV